MVITLNVSDQVATRVVNALCDVGGYSTVNAANAKTTLLAMITQMVQSVESRRWHHHRRWRRSPACSNPPVPSL